MVTLVIYELIIYYVFAQYKTVLVQMILCITIYKHIPIAANAQKNDLARRSFYFSSSNESYTDDFVSFNFFVASLKALIADCTTSFCLLTLSTCS